MVAKNNSKKTTQQSELSHYSRSRLNYSLNYWIVQSLTTVLYFFTLLLLSTIIVVTTAFLAILIITGPTIIVTIPIIVVLLAHLDKIDYLYLKIAKSFVMRTPDDQNQTEIMGLEYIVRINNLTNKQRGILERITISQIKRSGSIIFSSFIISALGLALVLTIGYVSINIIAAGFNPAIILIFASLGITLTGGEINFFSSIPNTIELIIFASLGLFLIVLMLGLANKLATFHVEFLQKQI